NPPGPGELEERKTRLLAGQGREKAERALEPVHGHVGVILITLRRRLTCSQTVRIYTVDHFHLMPEPRQLVRQSVHKDPIRPKGVRGIEGRDHTKAEWAIHHHDLS